MRLFRKAAASVAKGAAAKIAQGLISVLARKKIPLISDEGITAVNRFIRAMSNMPVRAGESSENSRQVRAYLLAFATKLARENRAMQSFNLGKTKISLEEAYPIVDEGTGTYLPNVYNKESCEVAKRVLELLQVLVETKPTGKNDESGEPIYKLAHFNPNEDGMMGRMLSVVDMQAGLFEATALLRNRVALYEKRVASEPFPAIYRSITRDIDERLAPLDPLIKLRDTIEATRSEPEAITNAMDTLSSRVAESRGVQDSKGHEALKADIQKLSRQVATFSGNLLGIVKFLQRALPDANALRDDITALAEKFKLRSGTLKAFADNITDTGKPLDALTGAADDADGADSTTSLQEDFSEYERLMQGVNEALQSKVEATRSDYQVDSITPIIERIAGRDIPVYNERCQITSAESAAAYAEGNPSNQVGPATLQPKLFSSVLSLAATADKALGLEGENSLLRFARASIADAETVNVDAPRIQAQALAVAHLFRKMNLTISQYNLEKGHHEGKVEILRKFLGTVSGALGFDHNKGLDFKNGAMNNVWIIKRAVIDALEEHRALLNREGISSSTSGALLNEILSDLNAIEQTYTTGSAMNLLMKLDPVEFEQIKMTLSEASALTTSNAVARLKVEAGDNIIEQVTGEHRAAMADIRKLSQRVSPSASPRMRIGGESDGE